MNRAILATSVCLLLLGVVAGCSFKTYVPTISRSETGATDRHAAPFPEQPGEEVYAVVMQPQHTQPFPFTGGVHGSASLQHLPSVGHQSTKHPAYLLSDLAKPGAAFASDGLPQNLVCASGIHGVFSPHSPLDANNDLSQLAFATYEFELPGYLTPATIAVYWNDASAYAIEGQYWIGLSNWDRRRWDWHTGPQDSVLTVTSMAPYLEPGSGRLLVVVVLLGEQPCSLRQVRIGAPELRATGALLDPPPLYDNLPAFAPQLIISLPARVDLSTGCSPVRDQGTIQAGTSFAVAAGAYDYELQRVYGSCGWDSTKPSNMCSTMFMYIESGKQQGCDLPGSGLYTGASIGWLGDNGDATEINAPYAAGFNSDWNDEALADAQLLNIEKCVPVYPGGSTGVNKLKAILALQQTPLILRINLDPFFFSQDGSLPWSYTGPTTSAQALLITGYDDALHAFKVRNSWGADWCLGGYSWISYQTFNNQDSGANPWCWLVYDDYDPGVAQRFCPACAPLPPPTGVAASQGTSAAEIRLAWEPAAGADGYRIYRDRQDCLAATVTGCSTWNDTEITDLFSHIYWVQAFTGSISSELSSPDIGFLSQAPSAYAVAPLNGQIGDTLQLHATVSGSMPVSYSWQFAGCDIGASAAEMPEVKLLTRGQHICTLTVSNGTGESTLVFCLTTGQTVFVLPDATDTDWGAPVTGCGSLGDPFCLDAGDYSKEYSCVVNTMPDGSGEWLDNNSLVWTSTPTFAAYWTAPGVFQADQFCKGYIYM